MLRTLLLLLAIVLLLLYVLPKTRAEDDINRKISKKMKTVLYLLYGFTLLLVGLASWFLYQDLAAN